MDDHHNAPAATGQRGVSGYDWVPANDLIKVAAMVLMAIDHVAWAFSRHPDMWRALGRGSFPLFAALLVVGMRRTRSPRRYLMRLTLFALVSQYPFTLCFEGLNIGFTLAIGGLALYVGEDFLERNRRAGHSLRGWLGWSAALGAAGIVASLLRTDYGGMGILAMALLQRSPTASIGIPLMMGWMALFGWLRHWWVAYWGALVVGAAFLLGWWLRDWKRRFLPRWIVYAFYPVHLAIIGLILAAWNPGEPWIELDGPEESTYLGGPKQVLQVGGGSWYSGGLILDAWSAMSLRDVFCQDRAIGILQRGLAVDRPAHAYIFAGPEGVGKYKTAHEWAKLLLCQKPHTKKDKAGAFADSCGLCESCTLVEAGSHPDYAHVYKELLEYTRDGKDKKPPVELPIDVIREFLIEQVAIRPALSQRRVFVVSEAQKLNANSQNALLKVLEEPPSYCTIILLCTRLEQLLPTTKSRCQTVRFGPVDEDRIIARLREMGLGAQEAVFFARLGQGSLGLAGQWAQLELNGVGLFAIKRSIVASLADGQLNETLALAEGMLENAKQIAAGWADLDQATSKSDLTRRADKTLIQILVSALRDVTMVHMAPERPLIHADQPEPIARLAHRLAPEQALEAVSEGYEMLRWLEDNVNERLIFERLLLRLARAAIMTPLC